MKSSGRSRTSHYRYFEDVPVFLSMCLPVLRTTYFFELSHLKRDFTPRQQGDNSFSLFWIISSMSKTKPSKQSVNPRRRGKRNNDLGTTETPDARTDPTSTVPGTGSAHSTGGANTIEERLAQTQEVIERNIVGTQLLHENWMLQLERLSYMILALSVYQIYTPTKTCWRGLWDWNTQEPPLLSSLQIFMLALVDAIVPISAIITSILLVIFLNSKPYRFSHPAYQLANAVVPVMLAIRFAEQRQKTSIEVAAAAERMNIVPPSTETIPRAPACLVYHVLHPTFLLSGTREVTATQSSSSWVPPPERVFPVVLVFHIVLSLSMWFMQYQIKQQRKNLQTCQRLRQQYIDRRTKQGDATQPQAPGEGDSTEKSS